MDSLTIKISSKFEIEYKKGLMPSKAISACNHYHEVFVRLVTTMG